MNKKLLHCWEGRRSTENPYDHSDNGYQQRHQIWTVAALKCGLLEKVWIQRFHEHVLFVATIPDQKVTKVITSVLICICANIRDMTNSFSNNFCVDCWFKSYTICSSTRSLSHLHSPTPVNTFQLPTETKPASPYHPPGSSYRHIPSLWREVKIRIRKTKHRWLLSFWVNTNSSKCLEPLSTTWSSPPSSRSSSLNQSPARFEVRDSNVSMAKWPVYKETGGTKGVSITLNCLMNQVNSQHCCSISVFPVGIQIGFTDGDETNIKWQHLIVRD